MKTDPWVLGISLSHNGAACLLKGDQIIVAVQEERLSRIKRDYIYGARPSRAVNYCLDYAGIGPSDLNLIVVSAVDAMNSPEHDVAQNDILSRVIDKVSIIKIPHHFGHLVGVFATSGFDNAAALIIDGAGSPYLDLFEWERQAVKTEKIDGAPEALSETISSYLVTGQSVACIEKHLGSWIQPKRVGMAKFGSLGGMYAAVSGQIFGDVSEAGKVMGLAPYGLPNFPVDDFFILSEDEFIFQDNLPARYPHNERWPLRQTEYKNLAASVQRALEEAVSHLVKKLYRQSRATNLCYAGGVALNSVTNERIVRESNFEKIYIMPAAEDSGVAIGAAYYGYWKLIGENVSKRLAHDAVGKRYSPDNIARAQEKMPSVSQVESHDLIADVVDLLCRGKIVGWFHGRSELGPRALGQRSILCDPRMPDGKEILNRRVKHREEFRPFAPVILLEEAKNWFETGDFDAESPYMLRVRPFRKDKMDLVPAVVHVDGTGRVQTITREANGLFYELVRRFYEKTGVPIILNTSFNIRGEPIVETPEDALICFQSTGIDFCVVEDRLFTKHHIIMFDESRAAVYERLRKETKRSLGLVGTSGDNKNASSLVSLGRSAADYAGSYENPAHGMVKIVCDGVGLKGYDRDVLAFDMNPQTDNVYEIVTGPFKGLSVVFLRNKGGAVDCLALGWRNTIDGHYYFSRISESPPEKGVILKHLSGSYSDGSRMIEVRVSDEKLLVCVPSQRHYELIHCRGLLYSFKGLPGYGVEFTADQQGRITGAVAIHPELSIQLTRLFELFHA